MESFLVGFIGAIFGGVSLALSSYILYRYEVNQKNKLADKFINEFKTALANSRGSSKGKVSTLYPDSDKIN